ncbi:MAG: hypothetical protein ACLFV7_04905 [Phycisphaerae bacterium]
MTTSQRIVIFIVLALTGGLCLAGQEAGVAVHARGWSFNGQTDIPAGLFGTHHYPLNEERVKEWGIELERKIFWHLNTKPVVPTKTPMLIECFFDRYQPALVLTKKDWKQYIEESAAKYAEAAKTTGHDHIVEFWNEPYLNWACKPGVNYDGRFYETDDVKPGGRVTIKGHDKPTEYLVWDRKKKLAWIRGQVDYVRTRYIPKDLKAGDVWKQGSREYKIIERWWAKDTTQEHYWSGKQNVKWYLQMFEPFAKTIKKVNPKVTVLGGWGFNIYNEGWDSWRVLYKPLIDNCHKWMDGIHEHHYGGDTRRVAASYEAAYAYALGTYGKKLRFYNTETSGWADPEQPTARPNPSGGEESHRQGASMYLMRDITYLIAVCPDKAVSRTAHYWGNPKLDSVGFKALRYLRGKLLHTSGLGGSMWTVASYDPKNNRLCAVVFYDHADAMEFPLAISPPKGTRIKAARRIEPKIQDGTYHLVETKLKREGNALTERVKASGKSVRVYLLDLEGTADLGDPLTEQQFVSKDVVVSLKPGEKMTTTITIPAEALKKAAAARLRLGQEGPAGRSCKVTVNGETLEMKDLQSPLVEHPLAVKALQAGANKLVIEADKDCLVSSVSLIVTGK